MSREEECVRVESEHGAGEEDEAPTSRFQSIYRRQPKAMDLRSLKGGVWETPLSGIMYSMEWLLSKNSRICLV